MADTTLLRIVIVEDSALVREVLADVCHEDPTFRVVAEADDGPGGVEAVRRLRPDIVVCDLGLPGFDGFEVIARIMAEFPTPIVVVTATLRPTGRPEAFHALDVGAVHVIEKPAASEWQSPHWRERFRQELRFLSRAPVVRRMKRRILSTGRDEPAPAQRTDRAPPEVVVIVGSAGGAQAGRDLIAAMNRLPVPLLFALHLGPNLHEPLVHFLAQGTQKRVVVARDGELLERGTVHVAPGRRQIEFTARGRIRTFEHLEGAIYAPCHDHLLRSVASVYREFAAGAVLTGLGSNGAAGLLAILREGGRTLAQTEDSCLVAGMPRSAVALGAVERSLAPDGLGRAISGWFGGQ